MPVRSARRLMISSLIMVAASVTPVISNQNCFLDAWDDRKHACDCQVLSAKAPTGGSIGFQFDKARKRRITSNRRTRIQAAALSQRGYVRKAIQPATTIRHNTR